MNTKEIVDREYVKISPNREKDMRCLSEGSLTPKSISATVGIKSNSLSKYLKQLVDYELIYQTNSPARKDKLYALTPWGVRICVLLDVPRNGEL